MHILIVSMNKRNGYIKKNKYNWGDGMSLFQQGMMVQNQNIIRVYPVGNINAYTKSHDPSNSPNIKLKTTNVNLLLI